MKIFCLFHFLICSTVRFRYFHLLVKFKLWTPAFCISAGHIETHNGRPPQLVVAEWTIGSGVLLENCLNIHVVLQLVCRLGPHILADHLGHDCCGGKWENGIRRIILGAQINET